MKDREGNVGRKHTQNKKQKSAVSLLKTGVPLKNKNSFDVLMHSRENPDPDPLSYHRIEIIASLS